MCMHACMRACVCVCVRACVRACVSACVRACVRACSFGDEKSVAEKVRSRQLEWLIGSCSRNS